MSTPIHWRDVKRAFRMGGGSKIIIGTGTRFIYNGDVICWLPAEQKEAADWLKKNSIDVVSNKN